MSESVSQNAAGGYFLVRYPDLQDERACGLGGTVPKRIENENYFDLRIPGHRVDNDRLYRRCFGAGLAGDDYRQGRGDRDRSLCFRRRIQDPDYGSGQWQASFVQQDFIHIISEIDQGLVAHLEHAGHRTVQIGDQHHHRCE